MRLYDPRFIGISPYYNWVDNGENLLGLGFKDKKAEVIGKEMIEGIECWNVLLTVTLPNDRGFKNNFWIDDSFRVRKAVVNGVHIQSYYSETLKWLPMRVVTKEYQRVSGQTVLRAEREIIVSDVNSKTNFPKERWSLGSMRIQPKTDIIDNTTKRRIGIWDGKKIVPPEGAPRDQKNHFWGILILAVILGAPILYGLSRWRNRI